MISFVNGLKILLSTAIGLTAGAKGETTDPGVGGEYIDDIQTIYASSEEDAKSKLPDGYELTQSPIYENGDSHGNTYLAIKRTDDMEDAVRDIRAMNMVGGWSTNSYEEMLESQETKITALVAAIKPAILEFREKYPEAKQKEEEGYPTGTSYAGLVFDTFFYDDLVDQDLNPYTLLDIFMNDGLMNEYLFDDTLITIFMQAAAKTTQSIYSSLLASAASLNEDGDQVFDFDNIEDIYGDFEESDLEGIEDAYGITFTSEQVSQMVSCVDSMKDVLAPFANSTFAKHPENNYTVDDLTAYKKGLSLEDACYFETSSYFYALIGETRYLGGTLLDYLMNFDEETSNKNTVLPLFLEMSEAQRAVAPFAGLELVFKSIIDNAEIYDDNDQPTGQCKYGLYTQVLKDNIESLQCNVSVFATVDRRIFQAKGIALTSDAIRQNTAKNDFSWYIETNDTVQLLEQIGTLSVLVGSCILGTAALMYSAWMVGIRIGLREGYRYIFSQGTFTQAAKFWASYYTTELDAQIAAKKVAVKESIKKYGRQATKAYIRKQEATGLIFNPVVDEALTAQTCKNTLKFFNVVKGITTVGLVVIAVALICMAIKGIIQYDTSVIDYSEYPIPEMMVDERMVDDEATYIFYTNAKNVTSTTNNVVTADITQAEARQQSQWVSMYFTKDEAAGDPIYASSLATTDDISELDSEDEEITGMKKFGEYGIYNFVQYVQKDTIHNYLTYKSVDGLTITKTDAKETLQEYVIEIMGTPLGYAKTLVNKYLDKIEACETESGVQSMLEEAMNALLEEKAGDYSVAYPVYESIEAINDETTDEEIEAIRTAYDALTDDQKDYIENYETLTAAEDKIADRKLSEHKTDVLKEVNDYINSQEDLTEDEKFDLYTECRQKLESAKDIDELDVYGEYCKTIVNNKINEKLGKAASMFGEGNLGLLFIGLAGGMVIGVAGLYLTLKLLKKRKEEAAK